jgi:hypothetical protein
MQRTTRRSLLRAAPAALTPFAAGEPDGRLVRELARRADGSYFDGHPGRDGVAHRKVRVGLIAAAYGKSPAPLRSRPKIPSGPKKN